MNTNHILTMIGLALSAFPQAPRNFPAVPPPTEARDEALRAPAIRPGLAEVDFRVRRRHRLMEAQLVVGNGTDQETQFEYYTHWFDADGMEIPAYPEDWLPGTISGFGTARIFEISPSPEAVSFRIECREVTHDQFGYRQTKPISLCVHSN